LLVDALKPDPVAPKLSMPRSGKGGSHDRIARKSERYTARKLQYLAKVSGGTYFQFDPRTQERQFSEMFEVVSAYTASGEEAVRAKGGQAAALLLEHFKQTPMSPIEIRERAPAAVVGR
jgi:hypothetical protein